MFTIELPVTITSPLKEISILEHATATFSCEVSKANQTATWYKNGVEIKPDEKHEITVDGTFQIMNIKDTSASEDDADYTIKIGDNGSSAHLHVEGVFSNSTSEL